MPAILLDTYVLVWWWSAPDRLTKAQTQVLRNLERRRDTAALSAISLWELARLGDRGRIEISRPLDIWLEEIESNPLLSILPITARVALESVRLDAGFQKDPVDRIIVATARCFGLPLLTPGRGGHEGIRRWGKVPLI